MCSESLVVMFRSFGCRRGRALCLPAGLEGGLQIGEPPTVERVPDPLASPVSGHQAGRAQDLELVGDGRLALARCPANSPSPAPPAGAGLGNLKPRNPARIARGGDPR